MEPAKVLIFTHIPSPYQVELFNSIAEKNTLELTVGYLRENSTHRRWQASELRHNHIMLDDDVKKYAAAEALMESSDLVVFNYYQNPLLMQLIKHRASSKKPWCFWGERTGYRLAWLGTYYRKWKFSALHHHNVPIWGIGNWAVERYRQEFGSDRQYFNLPYFSNLNRFSCSQGSSSVNNQTRRFLYSGSLIHRKGVDLLADSFSKLADEFPNVTLQIMGEGKLRPRLEQQLAKYGDRVKFLGFQPWENLPQFYQNADILCLPSRHDGWALVVPEGLAAGLPVIGTNRTGAALELIKDNKNGWLIPANKKKALYEAMKQAAQLSSEQLSAFSNAAQMSVSQNSLADGVNRFNQTVNETLKIWQ